MGKLLDFFSNYFESASSEQLQNDWEELKIFNVGPDIIEVINNYGKDCIDFTSAILDQEINTLSQTYTNSDLCLAA